MLLNILNYRKEKKYELIYEEYGKRLYNLFTPKKYKDKDKELLMENKDYNTILNKYYIGEFENAKINKLIKQDKDNLIKDYRFLELCQKYSYVGNKLYKKMYKAEFEYETGEKYTIKNLKKYDLKKEKFYRIYKDTIIKKAIFYASLPFAFLGLLNLLSASVNGLSEISNSKIIKEYDEKLVKDVEKYNNMSDSEMVVSLLDDIRSNTYYEDKGDDFAIGNNYRLVLNDNNNHGVCRHMADKYTNSINLISDDYKAFNMIVYLKPDSHIILNNTIGLEKLDPEWKHPADVEQPKLRVHIIDIATKFFGNHQVSVIWSDKYNCYLVIDPTNPSIGVLEDGKIRMLNYDTTEFIEYRPTGQYLFYAGDNYIRANKALYESYKYDVDYDALKEEYGLDAQNKILEIKKNK